MVIRSTFDDLPILVGKKWYFGNGKFLPLVGGGEGPTSTLDKPRTLKEIRERQTAIRAAVLEFEKKGEEIDEEETQAWDDLLTEHQSLEDEAKPLQETFEKAAVERAQRMERLIEAARDAENRETAGLTVVSRTIRDPFENIESVCRGLVPRADLVARAKNAIERSAKTDEFGTQLAHDRAEVATLRVQGDHPTNDIARHMLITGHPEYQELFHNYLTDPLAWKGTMESHPISRTALSLTNAAGGFLLPYVLDPTIVLSNTSSANPYRRISSNKTTTSNAWQGVNSAGVTAAWLAEGAASADASPAVGQIQIKPQKGSAWIFGSYEVLADTDFAQQLPVLLADARDRLEEAAFTTGNGTTQPKGVITAATQTVNTATTLVFAIADIYKLQATLAPRFRNAPGAAWVMNVSYINKARQFDTAGGASFWTNLGKGQPETLLGAPIYESTTMFGGVQAIGSKIAVMGDFGHFYIVDRVGVSLLYEPLVKDQTTTFPTGQAGWFMFWRTGSDLSTVNAMQVLVGL